MKKFLMNLLTGSKMSTRTAACSAARVRLGVEALEERCTPSGLEITTLGDSLNAENVNFIRSGYDLKANVRR